MNVWTHVLAVVVGAARPDGDVRQHFGSFLGVAGHLDRARRLGLVEIPRDPAEDAPEAVLTAAGREFVEDFGLLALPAGRANFWVGPPAEDLITPAADELDRRWHALTVQVAPAQVDAPAPDAAPVLRLAARRGPAGSQRP